MTFRNWPLDLLAGCAKMPLCIQPVHPKGSLSLLGSPLAIFHLDVLIYWFDQQINKQEDASTGEATFPYGPAIWHVLGQLDL